MASENPLTEQHVRAYLRKIVQELNLLDERRAALQTIAAGYEKWLHVFASPASAALADRRTEGGAEGEPLG